jgi:tetratricopeptide (TPR) repeat protein
LIEAGQLVRARADLERAHAIRARAFGDDSPRLGEIEAALGDAAAAAGHLDDARARYDRAATLDPRLALAARRLAIGDLGDTALPPAVDALTVDGADELAGRIMASGEPAPRRALAHALLDRWRAAPIPVAPGLSCAVAAALDAVGDRAAAVAVYEAALAALADEPSRTRLRVLVGLRRDVAALRGALPELRATP